MKSPEKEIFKQGSTTYYFSSGFFPKAIRRDVYRLYSFMRLTDDAVDQETPKTETLKQVEQQYNGALKQQHFDVTTHQWDELPARTVKNIVRLTQKYKFDPAWVEDFLEAMKLNLKPLKFPKLEDTLRYVHGSAEVVGLMMAKIMKLPEEAYEAAKLQGRAMQWINFLRDIQEDNALKRRYFPDEDLKQAGLKDLTEQTARENPEAFKKFVDLQLKRYRQWQEEASAGFNSIPKRLRIPIQTAVDMYDWTAEQIEKDPFIVFQKTVKPKKAKVISKAVVKSAAMLSRDAKTKSKNLARLVHNKYKERKTKNT